MSFTEPTVLSSADRPQELRLHWLTAVFCSQLRTDVQGDQTKSCLYQFPFVKALEWHCDRCDQAATQACLLIKVEPGSPNGCHPLKGESQASPLLSSVPMYVHHVTHVTSLRQSPVCLPDPPSAPDMGHNPD